MLCILIVRLTYINYTSGDQFTKIVLEQQSFDSSDIAFQRGDIVDAKGTVLATSVAVYNLVLDCAVLNENSKCIEDTVEAVALCFGPVDEKITVDYLKGLLVSDANSRYKVLLKKLPYETIQPFVAIMDDKDKGKTIKGVWFEKSYVRNYPYNTLASSLLGFVSDGNVGTIGLECYYNSTLNGINGREYGYLNSDSAFEKTLIPAQDGNTLVTTLDANVQRIVENKVKEWNELYANQGREGTGSEATGVIIMNPNTGEIIAMADYPTFDLSNPRDLTGIMSQEQIDALSQDEINDTLNKLWQNFCITSTYEPGSVQKPFTVATGLETGAVNDSMTYFCDGGEYFEGNPKPVTCVKKDGHGMETVAMALSDSCNDSMMQMGYQIEAENFLKYQASYGFGFKTGIDLPGEANTSSLVFKLDTIKPIDLAVNTFGQGYNCTMVQMATAFSSLINGGTLYQPHIVSKIVDASGNTVENIEPNVLKQTISKSTSDQIRGYLYNVVNGGGAKYAKVDGYSMGGKTGTAEKQPRGDGNYLVSFMGYAPQENPQLLIYVCIDKPNWPTQDRSILAQNLGREILEEVLPYMNIYPDEEKTGAYADWELQGQDDMSNPTYGREQ